MERRQEKIQSRRSTIARKKETMDKIQVYVQEHLGETITLQDIARYCGASVSTITQLFQRWQGTTFHQYLTGERMKAAEELIKEEVPLEEVGRMVGYTIHSTFYRAFCQTYGMSPREYRKEIQKKNGI